MLLPRRQKEWRKYIDGNMRCGVVSLKPSGYFFNLFPQSKYFIYGCLRWMNGGREEEHDVNLEEKAYLRIMLRLGLFIIILIFNTVSYSQITERYWVPIPDNYNYCDLYVSDKLDLNEDGTYRCYYGICLIHHEEYGTYTMNKATLLSTQVAKACSGNLPYEAD